MPMKLTDQFDINLTDDNDSHEDLNFVHETEYTGEVLNELEMEEMQKAIEANTNVSEDILRQAIVK